VKKTERRQYLKNASRVLLTRARQGMAIFVPPGAKRGRTRRLAIYEGVSDYLTGMSAAAAQGASHAARFSPSVSPSDRQLRSIAA
jgi:hypothetical protein